MTIARCMANMLTLMISLVTVAPSAQGQQRKAPVKEYWGLFFFAAGKVTDTLKGR
jgi:hypothetical protein